MTDHLDSAVIRKLKVSPHDEWREMLATIAPVFKTWGRVEIKKRKDFLGDRVWRLKLVTGGWSGCEEAIYALQESPFWGIYLDSTQRGGLYTFEIPRVKGEKLGVDL